MKFAHCYLIATLSTVGVVLETCQISTIIFLAKKSSKDVWKDPKYVTASTAGAR